MTRQPSIVRPDRRWRPALVLHALASLALLVTLVPAGNASAEPARTFADPAEVSNRRLHKDGWTLDSIILEGAKTPGVRHLVASGRVEAPARDIWKVIAEPSGDDDTWPSLQNVVVERAEAETTVARYTMSVPVYPDRHYRLRSVLNPRRMQMDFQIVPGYGNVRDIKGYWKVTALTDSLSHVLYVLDTDPGVKLVPGFIIDWATRRTIPRLFSYLKEETLLLGRIAQRTERRGH